MATTFDPVKRQWTLTHRGLDFAVDADKVFAHPNAIEIDDRFDYSETRYITAGYIDARMVVIVWTPRGVDRHVISMRYCHGKEEARWKTLVWRSSD